MNDILIIFKAIIISDSITNERGSFSNCSRCKNKKYSYCMFNSFSSNCSISIEIGANIKAIC